MYDGPFGLPFVFQDSTGSLTNTTLVDIYGRLTIRVDESLSRPGRSVTMIRVVDARDENNAPLVPNAVLDFDKTGSNGLGVVGFPPKQNMPMESYLKKMSGSNSGGLLCRRFLASDGQEYKWTLISGGPGSRVQWTCATSQTNYLVASYEECDGAMTSGRAGAEDSRLFTVVDTWVYLVVELLTSLTIARQISTRELNCS
ncbi:hypothetical protein M407DRAFT_18096 [Tulasnella calospora MUT 4182]|uniref:Uncharacterized protein n=1 Tax=Tulasnella calospora MUT 4182 TaxID=1051891 RepID=A0A0C3QKC7_9AGAM|nr:hypothetical protein M407DRAFT_18096 [Tulasnella calospora MUT 4182]